MDPSTSSPSSEQPTSIGIRQRCFSLAAPGEATLHFQIIDLGQMYYVWLSAGDARLTNLNMAIKTRTDTQPSVATILPAPASSQSASLARRLAIKSSKPVLCSCNLPSNVPMLQAIAERRLMQELAAMDQDAPTK